MPPVTYSSTAQMLLQPIKRWTSDHLRAANIQKTEDADPATIIGPEYLPVDDDEEFEKISKFFCKSGDEMYKPDYHFGETNPFYRTFEQFEGIVDGPCEYLLSVFPAAIMEAVVAQMRLQYFHCISGIKTPIKIDRLGFKGRINILTAIVNMITGRPERRWAYSVPLATFASSAAPDDKALQEVPHALFQIMNAYNHNPGLEEYNGMVIVMDGLVFHFTRVTVSRDYVDCLCERRPLRDCLRHYRSRPFNLLEVGDRREFMRLAVGLLRSLATSESARNPWEYRF